MAYINLLPWRLNLRKEKQRKYCRVLLRVVFLGIAVLLFLNQFFVIQLDRQANRLQYLESELRLLAIRLNEVRELEETKQQLLRKIALIEQLQSNRNLATQILSDIARIVPTGVYLTQVEKKGATVVIAGKSAENTHLSAMLRDAEQAVLFKTPHLAFIDSRRESANLLSEFRMHLQIEAD